MQFALQTGYPKVLSPTKQRFADLAHAMQFIFPMETDDAILSWNHLPIRLGYKYDLSVMIDDLVPLLGRLLAHEEGHDFVGWGSDSFRAGWHMRWNGGTLVIDARWEDVSGGYETLLNSRGKLELPLATFVTAWGGVLSVIASAVERSGISLDDDVMLRDLHKLVAAIGELQSPASARAEEVRAQMTGGRRLRGFDLAHADLGNADLSGLHADDMDLRQADLRNASLLHAHLVGCRLDLAVLERADLDDATLRACHLENARAAGARFRGATLEDSFAAGVDLTGVDLSGAHLSETSFARAVLRSAKLDGAEGAGVELRGADLAGASLAGAELDDADFRGADLTGADLSGGCFDHADFRGAILDGVRWTNAGYADAQFDTGAAPESSTQSEAKPPPEDADQIASLIEGLEELLRSVAPGQIPQQPFQDLAATLRALGGGTTPEQTADLRSLMETLQKTFAGRGVSTSDAVESLLQELESAGDELPEALRPWLQVLLAAKRPRAE